MYLNVTVTTEKKIIFQLIGFPTTDNESLEQIEFISFMELGGYSGPITALSWHDQLDTEGEDGERDGLVSYEEWYNAFDRLNYGRRRLHVNIYGICII